MKTCPDCHHHNSDDCRYCGRCGGTLQESGAFALGATMGAGRYRIDDVLGEGGMGTVYKATDLSLDRPVALKVLHAELTAHSTARRRMEQEARILARIDHPNVVQVRNVFEEGEALVLELEYMSGGDLLSGTPIGGVPEADAVALMGGVLSGLQAVHDAGLVHRDVKPENILLAANGVPKITDLGIAHDPDAREKTRLGARMGTLEYMAPEQIQGNGVDARADVYAAGIVLYRILTGEFPYEATSDFEWQVAHVQEEPNVELLELLSSPALTSAILGALAKRPEERLGSALEFRQALEEVGEPIERPASAVPKASGPQPVVRDLDRSESGAMEKRAPPTSIPASPKAYPKPDTATRSWREGVNGPEHDKPGNDCGFAGFTLGATFVEACVFDRWTEPDKEEAAARAEAERSRFAEFMLVAFALIVGLALSIVTVGLFLIWFLAPGMNDFKLRINGEVVDRQRFNLNASRRLECRVDGDRIQAEYDSGQKSVNVYINGALFDSAVLGPRVANMTSWGAATHRVLSGA